MNIKKTNKTVGVKSDPRPAMLVTRRLKKQRAAKIREIIAALPHLHSQYEVGRILGISRSRVAQIEQEALWNIFVRCQEAVID